jgi:hypothetical protein
VLAFGDQKGAIGYLVGEPNRGLEYMFIMMNAARLSVGVEGYAMAERAFQRAADWARSRIQGRGKPIIEHPDVRRMLLTMKSSTEAMRSLGLYAAFQLDLAHHHGDGSVRAAAQRRADLLIPVVKGWSTEVGNEMAAVGVQVHGGMGFIEETGAAQYIRDARITTIYEGTTGIQANDLIGRKIGRDHGAAMVEFIDEMQGSLEALESSNEDVRSARKAALEAVGLLREATQNVLHAQGSTADGALAVAVPFLKLTGFTAGAWLMARSAAITAGKLVSADREFYAAKIQTARFYMDNVLPRALELSRVVKSGASSIVNAEPALI